MDRLRNGFKKIGDLNLNIKSNSCVGIVGVSGAGKSTLINLLFIEVNPIPVKKALQLMGMMGGTLRRPLTEMEEDNAAKLEKEMKAVGLL